MRQVFAALIIWSGFFSFSFAQSVNLSCPATSGGGQPLQILLFIDLANKFVRWQEPIQILEFRNGVFARAEKQSRFGIDDKSAGQQFVEVTSDVIHFGIRRKYESYDLSIDRSTGILASTNGEQHPCTVLPAQPF